MALDNRERAINVIRDYKENPPTPPTTLYNERWLMLIENMIENFNKGRCSRELLIIGGPRRTGKSTILQSILVQFKTKACYLDIEWSEVQNVLKETSLVDLVLSVKRELGCDIILMDEITALKKEWNYKVKELWDRIEQREKLFIIVAGSVGVLIEEGYSLLSGRRGFCSIRVDGAKYLSNPAVILPAKFGTFISGELFTYNILPLKSEERINDLTGLSTGDAITIKYYNGLDSRILSMLNGDLVRYLEMGGYPQLRDSAGEKRALRREIFDSLVKDITYYGLEVEIGRQFLEALRTVTKGAVMLDTNKFKERFRSELGSSREKFNENLFHKAKTYFIESYTFTRLTNEAGENYSHLEKLCINDPTIFWGLYEDDMNAGNQNELSTTQGLLFEHLVGSHLMRLNILPSFYNNGTQDVDYIARINGMNLLIQAAKSDSEAYDDLEVAKSVAKKLKLKKSYSVSLIMNADKITKTYNGMIIPASLFLALI